MKKIILTILLLLVSDAVFASGYICRGGPEEPIIEILDLADQPIFHYYVDGQLHLTEDLKKGSVQPVTHLPVGFETGLSFTYRPPEGGIHIYGRILSQGAIFDIVTFRVQNTLTNYKCEVKL